MIKKIVFLKESTFDGRDYERFGWETLTQNGFQVEAWDFSPILHPRAQQHDPSRGTFDHEALTVFHDKEEALRKLSGLGRNDFVIQTIMYRDTNLWVYQALSKSGAGYGFLIPNAIPAPKQTRSFANLKKIFLPKPQMFRNKIFTILPLQWLGVRAPDIIITAGRRSLMYAYPSDPRSEVLWVHALDYDLYLKESGKDSNERPIAVFVDAYYPFHPDHKYMGTVPSMLAGEYYPMLNRFFNVVETQLDLEVVIAAHPRSQYEKHPDYFEGRKWIKGETVKLIKDCRLVLAHISTSLAFANLFYKPVVFLTSSQLQRGYLGPFINEMSSCFGKKPLFIDGKYEINWDKELAVSRTHYDSFREDYIKTKDSENLPFWQIVANRLKKE